MTLATLDSLWANAARAIYGPKCSFPGCTVSVFVQVHHHIRRANYATRWYVPNGVPLCLRHHTGNDSPHLTPAAYNHMMLDLRGRAWLDALVVRARLNDNWRREMDVTAEKLHLIIRDPLAYASDHMLDLGLKDLSRWIVTPR